MRLIVISCLVLLAWLGADAPTAQGQAYPGAGGQVGGGRPGIGQPGGGQAPASWAGDLPLFLWLLRLPVPLLRRAGLLLLFALCAAVRPLVGLRLLGVPGPFSGARDRPIRHSDKSGVGLPSRVARRLWQ